jgi:hypothetical protein
VEGGEGGEGGIGTQEEGTWEEARAARFVEEGTCICIRGGHIDLQRRREHIFSPEEGTRVEEMV